MYENPNRTNDAVPVGLRAKPMIISYDVRTVIDIGERFIK